MNGNTRRNRLRRMVHHGECESSAGRALGQTASAGVYCDLMLPFDLPASIIQKEEQPGLSWGLSSARTSGSTAPSRTWS